MKRILSIALILLALLSLNAAVAEAPQGAEKALTVMIYMCGSNLESLYGSAFTDMEEIRTSGVDADAVNVLLLTGGSAYWRTGQDADTVELRALVRSEDGDDNEWEVAETLPSRSMGDRETLVDFIRWSVERCPAREYALILWDHGAGPLEGICLDEVNAPDRLSIDELGRALAESPLPGKLSWIGMDACLMASAEVAKAVAPCAEYMIASQETEPKEGWDYSFLRGIEADEDGAATGRRIVDAYFESQGEDALGLTLSCLDLSRIDAVTEAMSDFFEPIGRSMDKDTFAKLSTLRTNSASFGKVVRGLTSAGYDLVDLGDLVSHYDDFGNRYSVNWALESAVTYQRSSEEGVSGLSVYHPLLNKAGYQRGWKQLYSKLDFSRGYQKYMNSFGTLLTGKELADWSGISLSDDGFGAAGENLYSMQLTPLQRENFASAQLIVLAAIQSGSGDEAVYKAQLSEAGASAEDKYGYYPVLIDEVTPDAAGVLSASYTGRSLYLTDESGSAVAGPIGYYRSDDGEYWYIRASYYDFSGREDAADYARVLYTCTLDEASGALEVVNTEVYDAMTQTYTRRIGFDEANYTDMYVDRLACAIPEGEEALPAFADWDSRYSSIEISLPLKWRLRFFDEQMSGAQLYATLQITDVQQNSYCTAPIRVENPNLYNIDILPRQITGNGFELTLYAVQDSSALNPGLNIGVEFRNTSHQALSFDLGDIVLNGRRDVADLLFVGASDIQPGQTAYDSGHMDRLQLAGLGELTEMSFELNVWPAGGSPATDAVRTAYSVALSGCDASVTGGDAVTPLDEVVRGDVTWQLLDIRRNARGGLSGTLRVINDGDRSIYGKRYLVVNDRMQSEKALYMSVDAHMDACVPFEIANSAYGSDLVVKTGEGSVYRYMGIDHLMERFDIAEVTSLKLCAPDNDSPEVENVAFEWAEPVPVAGAGELEQYAPLGEPARLLLDGAFAVNVDRVLAADNGVALRLLIENRTDRDVKFEIKYPRLNGESAYLPVLTDEYAYAVGAGATLVANVALKRSDIEAVSEIGMCFRYGDFTTRSAAIAPDAPVPLGAEGGIYLSGADLRAVPADDARLESGAVQLAQACDDIEGVALELTAALTNEDMYAYDREKLDNSAALEINLRAENRSEDVLMFSFSDFTVNGTRYAGGSENLWNVRPGAADSCAVKLKVSELAGLSRVETVGFRAVVRRNGDVSSDREYEMVYSSSGLSLAGIAPDPGEALGETQAGGVTLRLTSLREGGDGALEGTLYLRNDSDAPLEKNYADYYINDVHCGLVSAALPAGTDRLVEFRFDNALDWTSMGRGFGKNEAPDGACLLQRLGMDAVRSVGLRLEGSGMDGVATLCLETPLPLSPRSAGDALDPKPLLEGDLFAGVTHVAATEQGLFLTLVLRNDSTEAETLSIFTADVDGRAAEPLYNYAYTLEPGTARVLCRQFATERSVMSGERLASVSLSFEIDDALAEGAVIRLEEPLTAGKAGLRTGAALSATPARTRRPMPAIYETLGMPGAERVYPVALTAPTEEGRAERFDHGDAVVCLRDEVYVKDGSGASEKRACLREICRIPLAADGGRLAAPYSGLILWDGRDALPTRETPLGDGGAELCADLTLSEDMALAGCWTVNADGSGPVVRAGEWTPLSGNAEEPVETPLLEDFRSAHYIQRLYFEDGTPDTMDDDIVLAPKHLALIPAQTLDAALSVRYEIHYTDGDSETIIVEDGLSGLREAEAARTRQAEYPVELELDDGRHIDVTPDVYETERFRVSVSARIRLEDAPDDDGAEAQRPLLGLCMKVENRSETEVDALSTGLVLNGERETGTQWTALRIKPGSTCVDTWYIEPEDLSSVGGVRRIGCTLNLYEKGGEGEIVESIPIDVTLDALDEAALWALCESVGETRVYGITWQLLSAQIDEYGRVTGRLNAVNNTNSAWELTNNGVLANGFAGTSYLEDIRLEPRSSRTVNFTFENFAWADCFEGDDGEVAQSRFILQSHDVAEVTALTFTLGREYDARVDCVVPLQTMTFELPEPLAVPPADDLMGERKLMLSGDGLSVRLESVLLGDDTLSVALEVRNDTDAICNLYHDHLNLNGSDVYWAEWKQPDALMLLPHTTRNCCLTAYLSGREFLLSDGISDIHICFHVANAAGGQGDYQAARVRLNGALEQPGYYFTAEGCEVEPATFAGEWASELTDRLCLPSEGAARPRTLTPPIDDEKAAMFESGEVSVMLRQEYDGYDYVGLDCETLSKALASLTLGRDAAGAVSAEYSGTVLAFGGIPYPTRERTLDGMTEISTDVNLVRDYYDAYELRDPAVEGETPDVVPVGEPFYNEVASEDAAPRVRAQLRYRLERDGDALISREERAVYTDPETGAALDGVADWMYHAVMVDGVCLDDDYDALLRVYMDFMDEVSLNPTLVPIERFIGDDWGDARLVVRYHIRYSDGSEETLVEPY